MECAGDVEDNRLAASGECGCDGLIDLLLLAGDVDLRLGVDVADEYAAVGGGSGGGSGSSSSSGQLPVFDKVASLPADAASGTLAYAESTDAAYLKVGQTWKKLAFNDN